MALTRENISPGYGRDEEDVTGNVEGTPALRLLIMH
jgi:hypothetical protein